MDDIGARSTENASDGRRCTCGRSPASRKRKADTQTNNNERLSKRLSLLNLEQNGSKLSAPVENPAGQLGTGRLPQSSASRPRKAPAENDSMQLDDSKHKVYIYNLEDELSDAETDDGKLLFLPDIENHLRTSRIPPHILASPAADVKGRELVLYSVPSSITLPEEQDSVRKAIVEARARIREKQDAQKEQKPLGSQLPTAPHEPALAIRPANNSARLPALQTVQEDPDAMELD